MNTDPGKNTEFVGGYHGDCGPTALAEAMASANGTYKVNAAQIIATVKAMQAYKLADGQGITTLKALAQYAKDEGFAVSNEWDYAMPFPHDWHAVLLANAGVKPMVVQLDDAEQLKDAETSSPDEQGVHDHFICVLDKQADGYKCADGDNPQATQRYAVYSYQTLINAKVCGLFILEPKESVKVETTTGAGDGFDAYCKAHAVTAKLDAVMPIDANHSAAVYDNGLVLYWEAGQEVSDNRAGTALLALWRKPQTQQKSVPTTLHSLLSNFINATASFAEANASAKEIAKELGY